MNVVDEDIFERSLLAKPSNLGTVMAVSNLKSVIQGESLDSTVRLSNRSIVIELKGDVDGPRIENIRA